MTFLKPIILCLVMCLATVNVHATSTDSKPVRLQVTLSDAARAKLGRAGESVTVASYWYGSPKPAFASKADETGQIQVATRTDRVPFNGGDFSLEPGHPARTARNWIEGPLSLNVNVYSSRDKFADNVLSCDFIDGQVVDLLDRVIHLHCALITENLPTRHFPGQD